MHCHRDEQDDVASALATGAGAVWCSLPSFDSSHVCSFALFVIVAFVRLFFIGQCTQFTTRLYSAFCVLSDKGQQKLCRSHIDTS